MQLLFCIVRKEDERFSEKIELVVQKRPPDKSEQDPINRPFMGKAVEHATSEAFTSEGCTTKI